MSVKVSAILHNGIMSSLHLFVPLVPDSPCIYGQCKDGINQYHCNCSRGYEGHDCDIEIDECQSVPCLNNATCVDEVGNFSCACALGYQGD